MKNSTFDRTQHPAHGCTQAQREVFEMLAIGQLKPCTGRTLKALLDKGLIARGPDRILGRDRFGEIAVPDYYVPLPLHAQWCQWCSENVKEESDDGDRCATCRGLCWNCGGEGFVITCWDDLCHGAGECMHGDGEAMCNVCKGEGCL